MKSRRNNDERRRKRAFVAPTDFGSHSMLHQTLLCSSSSSPFSPSPLLFNTFSSPSHSAASPLTLCAPLPPPLSLAFNYSSQVEKESRMEALRASLRPESLQQQQLNSNQGEEMVWGVERGNLLGGEGFSVDDLLNLGEFADNEWEAEETESEEEGNQQPEKVVEEETVAAAPIETKENPDKNLNSNSSSPSSSYSALSFEPPQLPLVAEISLPAHDASDLEWVSYIIDDSLSEFPMCSGVPPLPPAAQALKRADPPCQKRQDHVPAAKEASFLNPTVGTLSLKAPVHVKAKRSKRARTSAVLWPMSVPRNNFADASSSSTTTSSASSCSSASSAVSSCLIYDNHAAAGEQSVLLYGSHLPRRPPPPSKKHKPKKRGRKPKQPTSAAMNANGERRCSHCGVQKTPQWRTGPLGAKTLCNACGVRFKSGRLLPEYRPACSPTFISTIHSNSHRKVLEMRRKKETEIVAAAAPPVASF